MNVINKEMIEALFTAFVGQAVQLALNNYHKLREQIVAGVTAKNKKELYDAYKGKIVEVWDNYNALLSLLLPYGDYLDISEIKATWITTRDTTFKDLTAQLANYNIRKSYVRAISQTPFETRTLSLNQESLVAFTSYAEALSLQVLGYQQVYEITYKLSNPIELTDTPFWLKELGKDEITYYKSEDYDGLIYSPVYPTTEKSVSFVHIFNPTEAILDFKILNEGYVDQQKGFWVETLNNPCYTTLLSPQNNGFEMVTETWTTKDAIVDLYSSGKQCIINNGGDIGIDENTRAFFNKTCTIIKRTKAGLIQVSMNDNPKSVYSFPQRNVDLI